MHTYSTAYHTYYLYDSSYMYVCARNTISTCAWYIHRICLFYSEIGPTTQLFFFSVWVTNFEYWESFEREKNTIHGKKSQKKTQNICEFDLREIKFKKLKKKSNMKYTTTHSPMCASLTANKK